jgi:uncharacterized protein (DUF2147 family)
MQKRYFLFALLLIALMPFAKAQNANANSILGTWLNQEKDGKIEIYQVGTKYFGKLVWGKTILDANGNSKKDTKNPDDQLKTRNLLNLLILTDFVYSGGQWEDGKIYDPKSGKTYSSVMKLDGDNLDIRGYVGISLFGRTTVWTRVH